MQRDEPNKVEWEDFGQSSQRLVQNVTGTGLSGSWLSPVRNEGASSNSSFLVQHSSFEYFRIMVYAFDYSEGAANVSGLQANGFDLGQISLEVAGSNPFGFGSLTTSSDHNTYLADYIGSYDGWFSADIYDIGDDNSLSFSITNVTISQFSAVPEPSSYAALFGGIALAGTALRRRRCRQT